MRDEPAFTDADMQSMAFQWLNGNHNDVVTELMSMGSRADFIHFCNTLVRTNQETDLDLLRQMVEREEKYQDHP